MPRLTIELPETFPFSTELDVRISDINYGGHLGNDAVLSLLHEARVRFLSHHGFSEMNIEGRGIIMVDSGIMYRAEVFHGEKLKVEVGVTDLQRSGCDFVYRISRTKDGHEVARAKTGIAFFDYEKKRIVAAPEKFLLTCASQEGIQSKGGPRQ